MFPITNSFGKIRLIYSMILVYIYIYKISSSSCRATCTDLSDPLSPSLRGGLPGYILYWYIGSSWSSCLCSFMWRGPQEYIAREFVLTSPAVSRISNSSNLDSFRDGWPYSYCLMGFCLQHSCVIAVKLFFQSFS